MLFHFVPLNPAQPLYAEKVHPASLVSYETKNDVLSKLCELYLNGKVPLADLNNIMEAGYDAWKIALYNFLPADEQVYHEYLATVTPKVLKKSLENQYLDDEITLQEYNDMKFPERKKNKDLEWAGYPQPYTYGPCKVCASSSSGLIKCHICDNLACIVCVKREFLDPSAEGAFILMHRRFCMKFGAVPKVSVVIQKEPGFLRELRLGGREVAIEELKAKLKAKADALKEDVEPDEEEAIDEDDADERRRLEEEALKADTAEVSELKDALSKLLKKVEKTKEELLKNQEKLEDQGRGEYYLARCEREKSESIKKVMKYILLFEKIKLEAQSLVCYPPTQDEIIVGIDKQIAESTILSSISSLSKYHEDIAQLHASKEKKTVDEASLLLSLTV